MNSYTKFSYPQFDDLPSSLKVLYTCILIILGIGYIFAMIQIYEVHAGRDGKPGISVKDIVIAYRGDKSASRIEGALNGPMSGMLPAEEKATIIAWVHDGEKEDVFHTQVEPILKTRCQACHSGSNPHIPTLMSYDDVKTVAQVDTGVSIGTLVRVSHIHLFGLTFIFGFLGLIFSHSYMRRPHMKSVIIVLPFLAILMDITSWWLTKVSEPFGYVVIASGALMAFSFTVQWVVSFYQMWFFKCPSGEVCLPK